MCTRTGTPLQRSLHCPPRPYGVRRFHCSRVHDSCSGTFGGRGPLRPTWGKQRFQGSQSTERLLVASQQSPSLGAPARGSRCGVDPEVRARGVRRGDHRNGAGVDPPVPARGGLGRVRGQRDVVSVALAHRGALAHPGGDRGGSRGPCSERGFAVRLRHCESADGVFRHLAGEDPDGWEVLSTRAPAHQRGARTCGWECACSAYAYAYADAPFLRAGGGQPHRLAGRPSV